MARVSFNVLDGFDAGRSYCSLATPVTIGREEGNLVRLNDERVSRFHVKVQEDQGHVVLTDLESTNGTRVNGESVRVALLRPGDQIRIGGTLLVYGSREEILARIEAHETPPEPGPGAAPGEEALAETPPRWEPEVASPGHAAAPSNENREGSASSHPNETGICRTLINEAGIPSELHHGAHVASDELWCQPPALPGHLSPAQAAQLSELLSALHRRLRAVIDSVSVDRRHGSMRTSLPSWQRVLSLQMDLARLLREIAEPKFDDL